MRVASWLIGGALVFGACVSRADIINPSSFTSGQYVSYATPGVTLSTMTLVPVETYPSGGVVYGPNLGPVYALDGTLSSSPSVANLVPWGYGLNQWGFTSSALYIATSIASCLQGCESNAGAQGQWLRVDFSNPVNFVQALQSQGDANFSEIAAFNSNGQLVGTCAAQAFPLPVSSSCASIPADELTDGHLTSTSPWLQESVLTSSDSISTVLIGSVDGADLTQIGAIEFGTVPEPATFGLLSLGLLGLAWSQRRRFRRIG